MRCEWRSGVALSARMMGVTAILLTMAAAACAQQPAADKGQEIVATVCATCHSPQIVTASRRTRQQWQQTVRQMINRGAPVSDEQFLAVVNYLSARYGRVNVNTSTAEEIATSTDLSSDEANAIVAYRRDHGTINDFDELKKIPGLDANKLEANRDGLTFGIELPGVGRVSISALTEANNWPTVAGSPQRDGWAQNEELLSKDTVTKLKLLYKRKFDNQSKGLRSLTPPIVLGSLLGNQGFKQMLILGGSSDDVYSIDADLDREIWSTHLDRQGGGSPSAPTVPCPVALTAMVIPGATAFGGFSEASGSATRNAGATAPGPPPPPFRGFGVGPLFTVTSDGYLHTMYQSNGVDEYPPTRIVPANSNVSSININKTTLYATTEGNCGSPNGIYAFDVTNADGKVVSFPTNGTGPSGSAGTAIGRDDTVYAQIADGEGDVTGRYNDTVLALTPNDLKVRDYFTPSATPPALANNTQPPGVTPAVFRWKNKDIIVAAGRDGRLYLLDSTSLGGPDHHTPLYSTDPVATNCAMCGIRGAFATWEDPETKTRWVYASLWGPPNSGANLPPTNGAARSGSITAFKVEDRDGKPALVLAWISREMIAPAAPIISNGLVFALSTGQPSRLFKDDGSPYGVQELEKMAKTAVLYVLDSATGKELFSSGNAATSFSYGSGLAVANGHIYFTTHDNTVYSYGFPMEH